MLAAWVFLTASFGLGVVFLAAGTEFVLACAAIVGAVLGSSQSTDALFLAVPLLLVLVWSVPGGALRRICLICLFGSIALLTQIKLSAVPLCLLSTLLIDGARASERRWPMYTAGYILVSLAIWKLLGQNFGDLPPYVRGSLDIISGYDSAMQVFGSDAELFAYLSCALFSTIWFGYWLSQPGLLSTGRRAIIGLAALAFLQVSFKAGFVRHDLHSLTAWLGLCLGTSLLMLVPRGAPPRFAVIRIVAILMPVLPAIGLAGFLRFTIGLPIGETLSAFMPAVSAARLRIVAAVLDGRATAAFDILRAEARQRIVAAAPEMRPEGPVDILPSRQADLIARDAAYMPRPVFQGYVAYTPGLAALNRAFFEGARAPRNVIFGLESVDGRYPATVDGSAWTALLGRYEPASPAGDYLLLTKRATPSVVTLGNPQTRTIRVNEKVPLWASPDSRAVFATIRLRETVLGHLLHLVWKPPVIDIRVGDRRDQARQFRLVPGAAEAGFILSPIIISTADFLGLYRADIPSSGIGRASTLTIGMPDWGRWVYRPDIEVDLSEMAIPAVRNPLLDNPPPR